MIPENYIFNHVPKTGGISVLELCRQNLAADEISPHLREHEIRQSPKGRWERFRMIAGHFSIRSQAQFVRGRYSITWLRHPLRRIVSQYTFSRQADSPDLVAQKAKELAFPDFVRYFQNCPLFIRNVFTHHFAALDLDTPGEPEDKDLFLACAKHNLAAFNFVGICEEFDQSVRMLCADLGWHAPQQAPHENQSKGPRVDEIDSETMALLIDRNGLDMELYEFAKRLFRAQQEGFPPKVGERSRKGGSVYLDATRTLDRGDHGGPASEVVEMNRFVFFPSAGTSDRAATITRCVATPVHSVENEAAYAIELHFMVRRWIEDLVAGVLIHDADGNVVFGTTTLIEQCDPRAGTGHDYTVRTVFKFGRRSGTYRVTLALQSLREAGYHYHWIDHALALTLPDNSASDQGDVQPRAEVSASPEVNAGMQVLSVAVEGVASTGTRIRS